MLDDEEQRFMDHLISVANREREHPNYEAIVLFGAIQTAFTKNYKENWDESVPIHPDLVINLAACAWVGLGYDKNEEIRWDGAHDYIFNQTLVWFMGTLQDAIREKRVVVMEGKIMHGCFEIPKWFFEKHHSLQAA